MIIVLWWMKPQNFDPDQSNLTIQNNLNKGDWKLLFYHRAILLNSMEQISWNFDLFSVNCWRMMEKLLQNV